MTTMNPRLAGRLRRARGPEPTETVVLARFWRERLLQVAREGLVELRQHTHRQRLGESIEGRIWSSEDHSGEAAIAEDEMLDKFVEGRVAPRGRRDVIYWGEERPAPAAINWRPGMLVIETDVVDGSKPKRHLDSGYAVVLTVWRKSRDERLRQLAGVIVKSNGTSVSWNTPEGVVQVDHPAPFPGVRALRYELRRGDITPGDPKVMAVVAARHDHRYKLVDALDDEALTANDVTVYNQAGNPSIVDLLQHELSLVFELRNPTTWDAAALVPLELAGGTVFSLDGRPRNVLSEMESLVDLHQSKRRIAPYVAVSHPLALETFEKVYKCPR